MNKLFTTTLMLIGLAIGTSGCTATHTHHVYHPADRSAVYVVVKHAPPPPPRAQQHPRGHNPPPYHVWIPGHWVGQGYQRHFVPGHWAPCLPPYQRHQH